MKIAWFTPFTKRSAIGKYSQSIIEELNKYCNVDLFLSQPETKNILETSVQKCFYHSNENLSSILAAYDLAIYNIGDCLEFHQDIYEVSQKNKGIVILHDYVMHHFFAGYYLMHKKDIKSYIKNVKFFYGEEGEAKASSSVTFQETPVWDTDDVVKYPLYEKATKNSLGVITHSHFFAKHVRDNFCGPVSTIYFPSIENVSDSANNINKADLEIDSDKLLLLTVGHVNPNKRIDKTIEALGANQELFQNFVYIIIGSCEHQAYYRELQSLVEYYSLEDKIRFLNFQPEETLKAYLYNADIIINLRYPAMEGASWSLIEQMHYGKPIIVTNTGFYSEMPDDCVLKISPANEKSEIESALESLFINEKLRKELGMQAKKFANTAFTTQNYCQEFLEFANTVCSSRPQLELIDTVSAEMQRMGIFHDMEIIDKVSTEIYNFFN